MLKDEGNLAGQLVLVTATDGLTTNGLVTLEQAQRVYYESIYSLVVLLGNNGVIEEEIETLATDAASIFPYDSAATWSEELAADSKIAEKICEGKQTFPLR